MQFKYIMTSILCFSIVALQAQSDSLMAGEFEQVVITSQFLPTDVRETVNSVKVIGKKTIEQRAAVSLGELLQNEANMRLTQDAILGTSLNLNGIRGQNIKILIDGVPVIGRQNGNVDAGQLSMVNIQQVEIIEGAQSLLYGSDASAGIVNIVTKRSQLNRYEANVSTQFETIGLQTIQAGVGARFGKFFVQLSGNSLAFEPATDTAYGRDQLWNPKKQHTGRALVRYSHSRALDLRLTGSIFEEEVDDFGDLRRPTYQPYAFDDFYISKRKDVNLSGEGWMNDKWFWQSTVALNRFDRYENTFRFDFDDEVKTLIPGDQDTTMNVGLLTRFTIASKKRSKLNYLFGIDNQADQIQGLRVLDSLGTEPGRARRNDFGLFASLKYAINKDLTLQGGARLTENSLYGMALTPSLWAKYRPTNTLQFRASYANGFRSPDLLELYYNYIDISHFIVGNTELRPETSHNLRAEADWTPKLKKNFRIAFNATTFYNKVSDRIFLLEFEPIRYRYMNMQEWETLGASLGFTLQYKKLTFNSQLMRTGFFNSVSEQHDSLARFNWAVDWVNDLNLSLLDNKVNLSLWHKATGATPFFYEQDGEMRKTNTDAWNQINFSASTTALSSRIRINAGVKNLLDVQQIRANNEVFGHNGGGDQSPVSWGRSFFVTLTAALNSKK